MSRQRLPSRPRGCVSLPPTAIFSLTSGDDFPLTEITLAQSNPISRHDDAPPSLREGRRQRALQRRHTIHSMREGINPRGVASSGSEVEFSPRFAITSSRLHSTLLLFAFSQIISQGDTNARYDNYKLPNILPMTLFSKFRTRYFILF